MINAKRLLNVARALRESKNPDMFCMSNYGHPCGTPSCALGHYAARQDLQSDFRLESNVDADKIIDERGNHVWYDDSPVLRHFGLNHSGAEELFSAYGCGEAQTAVEAAEYIEKFVAEHERAARGEEP